MTKSNTKSIAISEGIKKSNAKILAFLTKKPKFKVKQISKELINEVDEDNADSEENMNLSMNDNIYSTTANDCYFEEDIADIQISEEIFCSSLNAVDDAYQEDRVSVIEQRIPSFDVKKLSKNLTIMSNQSKLYYYNKDDLKFLRTNGEGNVRKGTLARALLHWSEEFNVTHVGMDALMNILYGTFKGYDLPVQFVRKQKPVETLHEFKHILRHQNEVSIFLKEEESNEKFGYDNGNNDDISVVGSVHTADLTTKFVRASLHEYSEETTRYVAVDQCINDCYVFAGENDKKFTCPYCQENRFRACIRPHCEGKGTNECEHLREYNGDGIAVKKLFYRPLLVLISDLLRTPRFLSSLRYKRIQTIRHDDKTLSYSDVMDGEVVKKQLSIMHSRYNSWRSLKEERVEAEEVSLILSEFYDGGQLFKSKTSNFWVLMTQILNLPPSFRGKLGVGMFLSAIYSGKHLEAEKFLFTDMYCEELRLLNVGTELKLNGKRYYIQARLILHTLDTKASEAVCCLQSVGSAKYGCPFCDGCSGVHDGAKCVYIGHRQLLPQNAYLRFLGQSGRCCPLGYYVSDDSTDWKTETFEHGDQSFSIEDYETFSTIKRRIDKEVNKVSKNLTDVQYENLKSLEWNKIRDESGMKHLLRFCLPCNGNKTIYSAIQKFFLVDNSPYFWSHKIPTLDNEIVWSKTVGLRKYLIYRHFDFRPFKPYRRVAYKDHLESATQANILNSNNKAKKKKHVNGIQDVWSFDRLPYADISQQVTWPFVHAVTGVIKNLTNTMLGENQKLISTKKNSIPDERQKGEVIKTKDDGSSSSGDSNDFNEDIKQPGISGFYSFRTLHSQTTKQDFNCSQPDKKRCREWLGCIALPVGLNEDSWDMRKFLINDEKTIPGFMKMNQRLKLVSCFWELILFAMNGIEEQYKLFYRMVGKTLTKLQSLYFTADDITQLSSDVQEMVCLWEGMLPLKTCTFQLHELIDLAPFINNFGPPMGVSEFPGERAVGAIINRKLRCNAGGQSFENLVVQRHIQFELRQLRKIFSSNTDFGSDSGCTYSTNGDCSYTEEPYSINSPESSSSKTNHPYKLLTEYELDFLIDNVVTEIEKRFRDDFDQCLLNSAVYRIAYKKKCIKKNASNLDWLKFLVQHGGAEVELSAADIIVAQNILSFKPKYFQRATIGGIAFRSRGSWHRETQLPKHNSYGRELNKLDLKGSDSSELNLTFRDKESYSSWCFFSQDKCDKYYAQVNAFFQIQFGDVSIDGLLVASVTARNHNNIPKTELSRISRKASLNIDTLFVSLKHIYPTRIATLAFADGWKAINVKSKNTLIRPYSTSSPRSELKDLVMLTLHPERLTFRVT